MLINYAVFRTQARSRTMKTRISQPLNLYIPSETLTSIAWPSSKSNVTTQKQVTHLLKRSQGKIGPSKSPWRNISSPSQTAIFFQHHLCSFSGGYKVFWRHFRWDGFDNCSGLWVINKSSWSNVSKWRLVVVEGKNDKYRIPMSSYIYPSNLVTLFSQYLSYSYHSTA